MKILFNLFCLLVVFCINAQVKLVSWNIENIGKSKSDQEISFIANTISDFDLVAIQEVVAGFGGTQAIARLADELNRGGTKWNYIVSDPTSSSAYKTERYAFLWKNTTIKLVGKPWLEEKYNLEIDREPFYATFQYKKKQFTVVNFHAITKNKQPEREIKFFKFLPFQYPTLNLIFVGDFNCPQSHTVFNPLNKMGYKPVLVGQKTSLKKSCIDSQCLASEFDNIFYNDLKITIKSAGIIPFFKIFGTLQEARKISDHIPIWAEIILK
ncbi:endonuclease/exonuclease/phosphatase family protein [Flavobacterium sp. TAB 87]|uniref:endonuclease/exonuclease/phosphatase family protein n=1 Tax=Flavobacterium sp. TAB 87 TaxID=1729581 RepID=UPI00076C2E63|nr:endonuclease/exonuclease/phosphatase family protein [Flavobacterium sp. TAB 87]KVV14352.1 Endonuclease/Exonuclease/phosphatase family protein [Flavobacterium sp. TAB 87]